MILLVIALLLQLLPPASIAGTVVDSKSGVPIANVELALEKIGSAQRGQRVRTDAGGDFTFGDVQPGRYYLLATHPDYLDQAYGNTPESSMRGAVREFTLTEGQRLQTPIRMLRGATISGRIYDSNRAPVVNASVSPRVLIPQVLGPEILGSIQPYEGIGDGSRILVKTNDRGQYRITGVPPGEFYIAAAPSVTAGNGTTSNNRATTYYPGFQNPEQSVSLRLSSGADLQGIDFALEPVSTLRVWGRITNPLVAAGTAPFYEFYLVPHNARIIEEPASLSGTTPNYATARDEFELRNVSPGTYDLFVSYEVRPTRPVGVRTRHIGRTTLDIRERDVSGVTVAIVPGTDVSGRIVLDESAKALLPDVRNISFFLQPTDSLPRGYAPQVNSLTRGIAQDGTFVMSNATPGRYLLTVILGPRLNLYLSAARLGTRDIVSQAFDIEAGTTDSFVLEISGQAGRAVGVVTDRNSKPVIGAQVVFVPPLEMRRENPAYKILQTDAEGRYSVTGLRPGNYTAYAFMKIDLGKWTDIRYMSQFAAFGVPISIERNAQIQKDLKVIP